MIVQIAKKAKISGNYFADARDRAVMVRALKQQLALFNTKPFRRLKATVVRIPIDECDQIEYASDKYWECYIKYASSAGYHQTGTSSMGNGEKSVVDSRCKVYKVKRLRQADAGM